MEALRLRQKWTVEEEDALEAGVNKYGNGKWKNIREDPEYSHCLGSRSDIALWCYYYYHSRTKESMRAHMQNCTAEEKEALEAGIKKHGIGKWKNIKRDPEFGHCLAARSNDDLYNRYHCRTSKRDRMGILKQKKWTAEEEEALNAGVNKHGTGKWKDIQKDPEYSHCLAARSNKDISDKWRNMFWAEVETAVTTQKVLTTTKNMCRSSWTAAEDRILSDYIKTHGEGGWSNLPTKAGLNRCGKACRGRWFNYLRPDIKRGNISRDEEELIIRLQKILGNSWSMIAGRLPGRTANEIKNYWNLKLAKKIQDHSTSCSTRESSIKSKEKKRKITR